MAFPTVAATNSGNSGARTNSHTIALPAGIAAGDLLLVFLAFERGGPTTFPAGWTVLVESTAGEAAMLAVGWRLADGSEGATIVVTTAGQTGGSAHLSYRITGHDAATAPEAATIVAGTSTTPNPGALDPAGWDVEDTLWLAACGWDVGTTSATGYPANYLNGQESRWNDSLGAGVAVAERELATASEDAGAFTLSATVGWRATTIAVRPTSAAAAVPLPRRLHVHGVPLTADV